MSHRTANAIDGLHKLLEDCAELSLCPAISEEVHELQSLINDRLERYETEYLTASPRELQLYHWWEERVVELCERFEMEDLY